MTLRLTYLHVNLHIYDPAAQQAKIEAVVSFCLFVLKGTTCPSKVIGLISMSGFALFLSILN